MNYRIFALVLTLGTAAHAAELTEDEVVQSARQSFPLVLAAQRDVEASEGALRSARGGFDPTWRSTAAVEATGKYPSLRAQTGVEQPTPIWGSTAFVGYRIGQGSFAVYDGKAETNQLGEIRGGLRVPLWRDGPIDKRRAGITQQEFGLKAAESTRALTVLEAIRTSKLRYWDWVVAGQRLSALKAWLALADSRDSQLKERVARGDTPEIERAENQRSILQRRNAVTLAERDLAVTANELGYYLRDEAGGVRAPDVRRLPDKLPEPTRTALAANAEDIALSRRPDLARITAQRDRMSVEAEFARNQSKPAIDAMAAVSGDLGAGDPGRAKPVVEAMVFVDIPLFNRAALGRADSARAEQAKLELQLRLQRDRISLDVQNARVAVRAAEERARLAAAELEVARNLATAEWTRFTLGESTVLLVNLREQASAEAELRHIEAIGDHHRANANYQYAIGMP